MNKANGTGGSPPLLSADILAASLGRPEIKVLDATYFIPGTTNRVGRVEFLSGRIPGAAFFDIDGICDRSGKLPHMLPSPEVFAEKVSELGVSSTDRIVIYDSQGIMSAPRVWWMFRVFGHDRVSVLDGGLPKWLAEGKPLERGPWKQPPRGSFIATFRSDLVRSADQVQDTLHAHGQVVDARAADRYAGIAPEVWPGRRRGHMPGSINLPFQSLIDPERKTMLPAGVLRQRFEAAGVDLGRPLVASCGSGVTACVIALAAAVLGHDDIAIYDGSWAEWGLDPDRLVVTGSRPI